MLELAVLGSGSSGNSALVCLGGTRILVDAGLSARQLCVRLEVIGLDPDSLSGVVLTHEHGDHVRGLEVFCRKRAIPVYGTVHTCALVREKVPSVAKWCPFEAGSGFQVGGIFVETFSVPHDAVDPVGYVFRCDRSSIGVISDVGHVTRTMTDRLRGVNTLFAEANYDETMLQNDLHRPWSTKQRISNRHGHLSNEQTADLVAGIASADLSRVVLGHLSSDCNTSDLARAAVGTKLAECGHDRVEIHCAERSRPLPLYPAAKRSPAAAISAAVGEREQTRAKSPRVCESFDADCDPRSGTPDDLRQMEWAF